VSGISIQALEKRFDQVQALYRADLEIESGEFCVFVGPSGCGKTTFLRMIAGLEDATSGKIFIGEKDVTYLEPKNREVAMVFQNYALYPHFTVRGNLEYPLNILKLSQEEKAKRVEQVAKLLEIDPLLQRKPAQLSGGQRQRVAIGRALVREPKVFLFDEPLSNLDARLRGQMRIEIMQLHQRLGRTSIYVTHDQHEAMTLGDKLVVMNEGRILEVGPPLELYRNPQCLFTARFLGHPPLNVVEGTREEGQFTAPGLGLAAPAGSGKTSLGVRPEEIILGSGEGMQIVGKISFIEHLGREAHIRIQGESGAWTVICREEGLELGQSITAHAPLNHILWFNKNEQRIV